MASLREIYLFLRWPLRGCFPHPSVLRIYLVICLYVGRGHSFPHSIFPVCPSQAHFSYFFFVAVVMKLLPFCWARYVMTWMKSLLSLMTFIKPVRHSLKCVFLLSVQLWHLDKWLCLFYSIHCLFQFSTTLWFSVSYLIYSYINYLFTFLTNTLTNFLYNKKLWHIIKFVIVI